MFLLDHKIQEIRQRALNEVEDKLRRHVQYKEELNYNALSLYNALIDVLITDDLKVGLKVIVLLLKVRWKLPTLYFSSEFTSFINENLILD